MASVNCRCTQMWPLVLIVITTLCVHAVADITERESKEISDAVTAYEQSLKDAASGLHKEFESVLMNIRKQKQLDSTTRDKMAAWIEAEQLTFSTKHTVPFSPAMRKGTVKYLTDVNAARERASKVFERIHRRLESRDDTDAASRLVSRKNTDLKPLLVGKFHYNAPKGHIYTLFSDGSAQHNAYPDKPYCSWSLDAKGKMFINAKLPGCPPGGYNDRGEIDLDGQTHAAHNGGVLMVGRRIDP